MKTVKRILALCLVLIIVTAASIAGTLAYDSANLHAMSGDNNICVELVRGNESVELMPMKDGYTANPVTVKNNGNVESYCRVLAAVPATWDVAVELIPGADWTAGEPIKNQSIGNESYNIYIYTFKGRLATEDSATAILGVRVDAELEQRGDGYILEKDGTVYTYGDKLALKLASQAVQTAFLKSPTLAFSTAGLSTNPWAQPVKGPVSKEGLSKALATLPTGLNIKASVTNVVFGNVANYEDIISSCYSQLVDSNNPNGPRAYYEATTVGDAATWTVYILSEESISLPKNCHSLFKDMGALVAVDTANMDTSAVTDMRSMFENCSNLENVDVSNWDTSNVTDMSLMFYRCNSVKKLDVQNWNTSKVTDMSQMFNSCASLTYLDTSEWDVSNVTGSYNYMFHDCKNLTAVDVAGWVNKDTKSISYMFRGCNQLETIDVSDWDTSSVTAMDNAFNGCNQVKELNVSNWDTSKVTTTWQMFQNCSGLTNLNLTGWDTSNVKNMANMFNGCSGLTELNISSFNAAKVTKAEYMFNNCYNLTTICVSENAGWDALAKSHAEKVMFAQCSKLVGGNGTKFSSQYGAYARIDGGESAPGYFTLKQTSN